jgi:hypothetical protein
MIVEWKSQHIGVKGIPTPRQSTRKLIHQAGYSDSLVESPVESLESFPKIRGK